MKFANAVRPSFWAFSLGTILIAALFATGSGIAQDTGSSQRGRQDNSPSGDQRADKSSAPTTVKLQIHVSTKDDKPISEASVYVRFNESGGFLHHDKMAELDLKTNQDGTAKSPAIPQGKIMIQVIAKGWHSYGKWYDINQPEQVIEIKLEPPAHWY